VQGSGQPVEIAGAGGGGCRLAAQLGPGNQAGTVAPPQRIGGLGAQFLEGGEGVAGLGPGFLLAVAQGLQRLEPLVAAISMAARVASSGPPRTASRAEAGARESDWSAARVR
jgi:hypothetical protein